MRFVSLILLLGCGGPDGSGSPVPPSWAPPGETGTPTTPAPAEPLPLCINELGAAMARQGDGTDWVELFNPGSEPVSLSGWALGDGSGGALHPLAGIVPPRSAWLLRGPDLPLALDRDGDEVVLVAPDGRDQRVSWASAPVDFAAARASDCCVGPDCWGWTWFGSPGARNGGPLVDRGARAAWVDAPVPAEWFDPDQALPAPTATAPWTSPGPVGAAALEFVVDEPGLDWAELDLSGADGARVWIDGAEVARIGLPAGELEPERPALGEGPFAWRRALTLGQVAPGPHRLVAEVRSADGGPVSLELRLLARGDGAPRPLPPPQPPSSDEGLPDPGDLTQTVFALDRVHRIELFLTDTQIALLDLSTEEYVQTEVVLDGMPLGQVGIRRRGKYGSLRPMDGKPKLRLDLNRYVPGGEWLGEESILLDNAVQDCSFVKMPLSYTVFRAAGNPAPRSGYARVLLNGEDYGQYYLTEEIDDVFADREWGARDAVIYDGSYANRVGEPLLLIDLEDPDLALFDQESGPDVGRADLQAAADLLDSWEVGEVPWTAVGAALDWPSWHRHFAAEEWTGHVDGYLIMPNNYWMVVPDGRVRPVAWDVDQTCLEDDQWFSGARWETPAGRVGRLCRADPDCAAAWGAEAVRLADTIPSLGLPELLDRLDALSLDGTLNDPKRECDPGAVLDQRALVRAWIETRSDTVRASWAP